MPVEYVSLENPVLHSNKTHGKMDLVTSGGTVPLVIEISKIESMVKSLTDLSHGAARVQPPSTPDGSEITVKPIAADGLGLMEGLPGESVLVVTVGVSKLAFALPTAILGQFLQQLPSAVEKLMPQPGSLQ